MNQQGISSYTTVLTVNSNTKITVGKIAVIVIGKVARFYRNDEVLILKN